MEPARDPDLISATLAGLSGVIGWVCNSGICLLVINHEEGWMPAKRELTMWQIRYTLRLLCVYAEGNVGGISYNSRCGVQMRIQQHTGLLSQHQLSQNI